MRVLWVAVDWGTTNLSAYAIGEDGQILDRAYSDKGMSQLSSDEFEPALLENIERWLADDRITPVMACGMVGAQQGWLEVPYSVSPCVPVAADSAVRVLTKDPRIEVQIVPGVCQSSPEDVMRGEETQIAGYLAHHPGFSGVFCLPGTHSKWVHVEDGEIRHLTTFMTGELFGLLSNQSVLRFCFSGNGWDDVAFLESVGVAMLDPEGLTAKLFSLRPQALLSGTSGDILKARLSGLLIGTELAAAHRMWSRNAVVIIGDSENARLYQIALESRGKDPLVFDGGEAIVQGLQSIVRIPPLQC